MIDWGAYVRWDGKVIIPFARLVQLGLCHVFLCKGGQSGAGLSTKANLAAARSSGVLVTGCFYWCDPCNSVEIDLAMIDALIDQENPDIVILDIEQWWSSWAKYQDAIGGVIGWGDVPRFGPATLSEFYRKVAVGVAAAHPEKKVLIYTSRDFVNSWAPAMKNWLPQFDGGFVASWPDYGKGIYYLDWDAILAYPPDDAAPALPPGWTFWRMWQTSSRIRPIEYQGDIASGFDHNYDWGEFNGTVDDLLAWLGLPPLNPPAPPVTPPSIDDRVTALEKIVAIIRGILNV